MTSQSDFTAAVLDPALATPAGLIDPKGRPAGKRFDVYRNNVVSSLLDAMETAFPVICKLVGAEFFRAMAGVYVRAYPPQSPLLMFYGQEFPEFLSGFEPVSHLPYLPDVARLELARREIYHAADPQPFDPAEFSQIDPERMDDLKIHLAPTVVLLKSEFPVQSIWHFNMVDNSQPVPSQAQNVAIIRPELDVDALVVSSGIHAFLQHLSDQTPLGIAANAAIEIEETFDLSEVLGLMIGTKMIEKIEL